MDDFIAGAGQRTGRSRRALAATVAMALAAAMLVSGPGTSAVEAEAIVVVNVTSEAPGPTVIAPPPNFPSHYTRASAAPHGAVGTDSGGNLVFTPTPGRFGNTTVSYDECSPWIKQDACTPKQITVQVVDLTGGPDEPDPVVPTLTLVADAADATAGIAIVVDVLANDQGTDGEGATLAVVEGPSKGTAAVEGRSVRYTPAVDATGEDAFTYRVCVPAAGPQQPPVIPDPPVIPEPPVIPVPPVFPDLPVFPDPVLLRLLGDAVPLPTCADAVATITVAAAPDDAGDAPDAGPTPANPPTVVEPIDPGPRPTTVTSGGGTGPTTENPVVASVTSPSGDPATIEVVDVPEDLSDGVFDFGLAFDVQVPPGTPEEPLVLEFRLDAERYGIADAAPLVIRRNGVDVPACTGPGAAPDPCVEVQQVEGGDVVVRVRSSHASRWTLALPATHCPESGASVACMVDKGVLRGRFGGEMLPEDAISAGQLASVVHRSLVLAGADLPAGVDSFGDDDGTVHEPAINALVAADVLGGTGRDTYEPHRAVTWSEVADVLVRAHRRLGLALPDGFDASGSALDLVVALGLVDAPADAPLDPSGAVSRRLVARAVARLLDLDLVSTLTG